MMNRLTCLNGKIDYDWLNLSFESYKAVFLNLLDIQSRWTMLTIFGPTNFFQDA